MPYEVKCTGSEAKPGCGASVVIPAATDPDAALDCDCCPEDHHHGQAANETGAPCRPITITAQGPSAQLTAFGG
jgi:putative aminopeptidase FrvX